MFLHTQHSMQCTTTIYSRETIKRSRKSVPPYSKYVRNPTKTNSIKKTVDCCELYDLFKSNIIFFLPYERLSGISPFYNEDEDKVVLNVQKVIWKFDENAFADVTPAAKEFIKSIFVRAPE